MLGQVPHLSSLVVTHRLPNFFARVHNERALANDRFSNRFTGQCKNPRGGLGLKRDDSSRTLELNQFNGFDSLTIDCNTAVLNDEYASMTSRHFNLSFALIRQLQVPNIDRSKRAG